MLQSSVENERAPFRPLPFAKLPEKPRIAHPYFEAQTETIDMISAHYGRLKIHCVIYGEGPPLLLLHGLMTTSYSWRYVMEELGKHYTLYIPDLPGAGRSDKPQGVTYDVYSMADWIGEFQRAAGIRGCRVVGNSMAGYLAMWLALRDPHSISKLVNVHSPGLPQFRFYLLRLISAIPGVKRLFALVVRIKPYKFAAKNVHYYDETLKSLEEAREYGEPISTREGALAFAKHLTEIMRPSPMRELLRTLRQRRADGMKFPMPLLLLYAESDPLVPPKTGVVYSSLISDARLVNVPEASHFTHVDAPKAFCEHVLSFFGQA